MRIPAFLAAVDQARPLLDHPDLGTRWDDPSPLEGMSLGALTAHLARAVATPLLYLDAEGEGTPVDAAGYFLNVAELRAPLIDDPVAVGIRDRAVAEARPGPEVIRAEWDRRRGELESRVDDPQRSIAVFRATMTMDQYLITRMVEIVVHADDLATGLGVATPVFGDDVTGPVLECLWEMARRRGQPIDIIRAMTRVERQDRDPLRVL